MPDPRISFVHISVIDVKDERLPDGTVGTVAMEYDQGVPIETVKLFLQAVVDGI